MKLIHNIKKLLMVTNDETIKAKICKSNFEALEVIKKDCSYQVTKFLIKLFIRNSDYTRDIIYV